jgi:hypothetical protein
VGHGQIAAGKIHSFHAGKSLGKIAVFDPNGQITPIQTAGGEGSFLHHTGGVAIHRITQTGTEGRTIIFGHRRTSWHFSFIIKKTEVHCNSLLELWNGLIFGRQYGNVKERTSITVQKGSILNEGL